MPKQSMLQLRQEVRLLHQIANTISYSLDINTVLSEVVNLVSKTMRSDSCLIYLLEDDTLILKASKIPRPKMINRVAMHIGEGITGWVARHRKIVNIEQNAVNDKRFLPVKGLDEDLWEAFVSVPIIYKDDLIGVINVQNRKVKKYTKNEIAMLRTIATQVGGAISNAKLLSETRTLKETLATRKIVEKAKGILMKHQQISEDDAFTAIRKKSMDTKKTMKEVAEAIILALE